MTDERDESIRAAKAKVAALPADHRAALEGEFQRAEQEARQIMRVGDSWTGPAVARELDPTPDEQALAEIFWDSSGESIGWCEAFKYARAIIAAGWVPRRPSDADQETLRVYVDHYVQNALLQSRLDAAETYQNAGEVGVIHKVIDGRSWFTLETPERDL